MAHSWILFLIIHISTLFSCKIDSFVVILSPTQNGEFSYSMSQGLWIIDRTGQPVYVTFPGPVKLCPKKKTDVSTQTYIGPAIANNFPPPDYCIDNQVILFAI